uniref:THAP domain containing 7 n=1 Tax=Felis catus TaxID=9685 RepID=A0ABI8ACR8_FELCA
MPDNQDQGAQLPTWPPRRQPAPAMQEAVCAVGGRCPIPTPNLRDWALGCVPAVLLDRVLNQWSRLGWAGAVESGKVLAWPISVSLSLFSLSCSEGRGPTTPFSPPPPADVACFPVEEASAPAALPASPTGRLEAGLSSPFSDLLGPLGAQADEAGCSAQPSPEREPERQPSPLEPRPVSPSAYMLRLPPPAGAYIQNEHSYQVGSALLWKRRAEAALDALDKAQRQLQACKRREQRLRLRLSKLQQERAREKRAQADARQTLKEHVQDFAMQLSNSMA